MLFMCIGGIQNGKIPAFSPSGHFHCCSNSQCLGALVRFYHPLKFPLQLRSNNSYHLAAIHKCVTHCRWRSVSIGLILLTLALTQWDELSSPVWYMPTELGGPKKWMLPN